MYKQLTAISLTLITAGLLAGCIDKTNPTYQKIQKLQTDLTTSQSSDDQNPDDQSDNDDDSSSSSSSNSNQAAMQSQIQAQMQNNPALQQLNQKLHQLDQEQPLNKANKIIVNQEILVCLDELAANYNEPNGSTAYVIGLTEASQIYRVAWPDMKNNIDLQTFATIEANRAYFEFLIDHDGQTTNVDPAIVMELTSPSNERKVVFTSQMANQTLKHLFLVNHHIHIDPKTIKPTTTTQTSKS